MAPPTTTSTRAATIAHPAPASHHMTPNAASTGDSAKNTITGCCLITARALVARTRSISLPGMPFRMPADYHNASSDEPTNRHPWPAPARCCRHEWRTMRRTNACDRRRFGLSLTIHEDPCRIISVVPVVLEVRRAEPAHPATPYPEPLARCSRSPGLNESSHMSGRIPP